MRYEVHAEAEEIIDEETEEIIQDADFEIIFKTDDLQAAIYYVDNEAWSCFPNCFEAMIYVKDTHKDNEIVYEEEFS